MAQRTVFKFFGSFGPGGTFVTLAEKLMKRFFNEAYDIADANEFRAVEEKEIQKLRQDFVNDLFAMKGAFERKSKSTNPLFQLAAYADLHKTIEKYKKKLITLEKTRLIKEKIFYINEENQVRAEQAQQKIDHVAEDVVDNLNKMAKHILQPDQSKMEENDQGEDEEAIETRVTEQRAELMLEAYKRMMVQAREKATSDQPLLTGNAADFEQRVYEQLFVDFGEDISDIKKAFKHYSLDETISAEDT